MNIKILAVAKVKEDYITGALAEYKKRLTKFCNLNIVEIPAEKILSEELAEKYMLAEAEKIIAQIKPNSYVITLEITGKQYGSEEFAQKIQEITNSGCGDLVFVIGGANGLHPRVSELADLKLSFSKMTFAHQIVRIILLEQIYRSFKILSNEPYHR